jgi:hypothetical protein
MAINTNSLIGSIGGHVGLLLGVSILQGLTLMVQFFGNLMRFYMKKRSPSVIPLLDIEVTEDGESLSESRLSIRPGETTSKITNEGKVTAFQNENEATVTLLIL